MKRFIAILTVMLMLTGFTYKDYKPQKYATLGSYIYNLVNTTEIEINFIRAPKVSEYFGDIKDSDYYSGAFINAAVSGVLKFPQRRVYPWRWIKVSEAKQLMDRAYAFKTNQKILISNVVFGELTKMDKYKKVKNNYYITAQMEKDIFAIYTKKIADYKKGVGSPTKPEDKVNATKEIENDQLLITLDWGEKPTSGYALNIAGAREIGDSIEVYYTTTSPAEGQMNLQVITYPKDTIRLNVSNIKKDYKIITQKLDKYTVSDVKYFTQIVNDNLRLTLSLGEKPTGGYSIKITEAKQIGDNIMVKYNVKTPGEGDMVTQAITYPSDTIDVKVSDLKKKYQISLEEVKAVNDGVKATTARQGEYIVVTLDWGQKPTGGYVLKILEAKQVDSTIEVTYMTKSPGPGDIVTQALTYPKDSINVKVSDAAKEYKIVLIKKAAE